MYIRLQNDAIACLKKKSNDNLIKGLCRELVAQLGLSERYCLAYTQGQDPFGVFVGEKHEKTHPTLLFYCLIWLHPHVEIKFYKT